MDINSFADEMLSRINTAIDEKINSSDRIESGIVVSVNQNGSANIYFPPENSTIFTNISNQSPFSLSAGDSVEVMLKHGSYSNCWIIAKHSSSYQGSDSLQNAAGNLF